MTAAVVSETERAKRTIRNWAAELDDLLEQLEAELARRREERTESDDDRGT